MTVCLAAISWPRDAVPYVVGASDRMITAGDIQFEPPVQKIWRIGNRIAIMTAGDAAAQSEVCQRVWSTHPGTVEETVNAYSRELAQYNSRQAERSVLSRLGLDMEGFLLRERELSPELVDRLWHEISRERAGVETIVCGNDATGGHIYTVDDCGRAFCHDSIGFAAIGMGRWHAESQFMLAGYNRFEPVAKSLVLLYTAKKRAEVAPGVGEETDLFFIPHNGAYEPLNTETVAVLDKAFRDVRHAEKEALDRSHDQIRNYIDALRERTQQNAPGESPGEPPADTQTDG